MAVTPLHDVWSLGGTFGSYAVLVHGGAGAVPEVRRELHVAGCARAARAGARVLELEGAALDAVEVAVRLLEDDPLFNAGTGGCLNAEGRVELDAAIMEGQGLRAGAVCALRGFRDPISIARSVLEDGRHVLYAAEGARAFAIGAGFSEIAEEALVTEAARMAWAVARDGGTATGWAGGTVGAVAIDLRGVTASATSTGGLSNKRAGRVGDSPILGAGTYADDAAGAVSTTGHGEAMMRLVTAKGVADRLRSGKLPEAATREGILELRERLKATGGVIAVDAWRRFGLSRSTATMSWAIAGDGIDEAGI